LYAVSPLSVDGNPYENILPPPDPADGFVLLPNIPVDRFRVLKLAAQNPDPEIALVPNNCAEMTQQGAE
jgi:hypothetical protein